MGGRPGYFVFWGLIFAQNAVGAVLIWRRTGLPYRTAALAIGAAASGLLLALSIGGGQLPLLPLAWIAVLGVLVAVALFCMRAEKRVHPKEWAEIKARTKKTSAWEMILFRHVPVLRELK